MDRTRRKTQEQLIRLDDSNLTYFRNEMTFHISVGTHCTSTTSKELTQRARSLCLLSVLRLGKFWIMNRGICD